MINPQVNAGLNVMLGVSDRSEEEGRLKRDLEDYISLHAPPFFVSGHHDVSNYSLLGSSPVPVLPWIQSTRNCNYESKETSNTKICDSKHIYLKRVEFMTLIKTLVVIK